MNPGHVLEACRMRLVIPVAVAIGLFAAGAGAAPALADALSGVSCSAANACTAVGDSATSSGTSVTLAERWNGTSWSVQPTPTPGGTGSLGEVSCAAGTACMAVGSSSSGTSGAQAALALNWTGGAWTPEPVPVPAGAESSALSGVSCTSPNACMAVGDYVDSTGTQTPLSEVWNGNAWAQQTVAGPIPGTFSRVSCSAPSACTAVGGGWVEGWNGTSWSAQTLEPPPPPSGKWLIIAYETSGISCTSASQCTMVGQMAGTSCTSTMPHCDCLHDPCRSLHETLVEGWNGSGWNLEVRPSGNWSNVSCTSTACTAVGNNGDNETAAMQQLSSNGDGWTVQTPPNPAGATSSSLADVSCTSPTACTAVGQYVNGSGTASSTLAESWNGSAWTIHTTPGTPPSPIVATGSASAVGTGSATVSGTVNPNGATTTYQFDYGTSTSYGSQAPAPPDPSAGSGTTAQTESAALTGLSPNTLYHYRIEATNGFGTSYGTDQTFTTTGTGTSPSPIPIVTTGPVTSINTFGPGTATATGTVNANGEAATYRFDYGTSTSYGSQTISEPISSTTADFVDAGLTGLSPNTVYHYRIEATDAWGTSYGADQTFTTPG
jgi:hypothetical protein